MLRDDVLRLEIEGSDFDVHAANRGVAQTELLRALVQQKEKAGRSEDCRPSHYSTAVVLEVEQVK
jgi:hypothetical protein